MKLDKPLVAFAMGDPAGISSEIAARLLHSAKIRAAADIVAFGDVRVLEAGAKVAGVALDVDFVSNIDKVPGRFTRPVLVDLASLDPNDIKIGQVSQRGGAFAIENFRTALRYAAEGKAAAVFFTPFNKKAMRLAHASYDDEINFVRETLGHVGAASEFNVLDNLWNARVTSHIPLSKVAGAISEESILRSLTLTKQPAENQTETPAAQ